MVYTSCLRDGRGSSFEDVVWVFYYQRDAHFISVELRAAAGLLQEQARLISEPSLAMSLACMWSLVPFLVPVWKSPFRHFVLSGRQGIV